MWAYHDCNKAAWITMVRKYYELFPILDILPPLSAIMANLFDTLRDDNGLDQMQEGIMPHWHSKLWRGSFMISPVFLTNYLYQDITFISEPSRPSILQIACLLDSLSRDLNYRSSSTHFFFILKDSYPKKSFHINVLLQW